MKLEIQDANAVRLTAFPDRANNTLTPEQKERNWMMLWKVREQKFLLPFRMLLDIPECAFFDSAWGPLLQKDKRGRSVVGPGARDRGFFSRLGKDVVVGIEMPINVYGPATYQAWWADQRGQRDFIVKGVSLEKAREAVLEKLAKGLLTILKSEQP
jgi:hypothetical protein